MKKNTSKKVATLAERAKVANYTPPPPKYNPELDRDRDVTALLVAPEKTALLVIDMQNLCLDREGIQGPGAGANQARILRGSTGCLKALTTMRWR